MPEYAEHPAPAALAGTVACRWSIVAGGHGRVLPDACVDLIHAPGAGVFVAGPDTAPAPDAGVPPGAVVTAVRLRPGRAAAVFGLPATELCDQRVVLDDLWHGDLEARLDDAPSVAERHRLLLAAVAAHAVQPADPVAVAAVSLLARDPARRIGALARELAMSERQLHRRVAAAVGYGPKTLARILRFQRLLALAEAGTDSLAGLALRAGYADQSHMTAECTRLAGASPTAVLGVAGARGDRSLSVPS